MRWCSGLVHGFRLTPVWHYAGSWEHAHFGLGQYSYQVCMVPASSVFEPRLVHEIRCFFGVQAGNCGGVIPPFSESNAPCCGENHTGFHAETHR
jgi:hypothetical protein